MKERVEKLINEFYSVSDVALVLGVTEGALRHQIKKGAIKKSGHCADPGQEGTTLRQRNIEDINVSDFFGIGASWIDERSAAARGELTATLFIFKIASHFLTGGLLSFKNQYEKLDSGYYCTDAVVFLFAIMYLCRIKNPEQLRAINPGEFDKLLGLDQTPEAKCLRKKLKDIGDQQNPPNGAWPFNLTGCPLYVLPPVTGEFLSIYASRLRL